MQKIHIRMKNRPKMHGPVVKNKWEAQEHPSQDGKRKEGS